MFSINPFKNTMKAFALVLSLFFLGACSQGDSGGVIVVDDTPAIPVIPGPFGGPIPNDETINPPTPFIQPYTSQELQALVDSTISGGTLELDRDAYLRNPVFLDKPLTIKNQPGKRILIKFLESGHFLMSIPAAGTKITDLVFSMENNSQPFQGERDFLGFPMSSNFTLERNEFYLRNTAYSLELSFNDLTVKHNTFVGLCDFCLDLTVLTIAQSTSGEITGNVVVDTNNNYDTSLFLRDISNYVVKANVVRSYSKDVRGAITCLGCVAVTLSGNYLHDANQGRMNAPNGEPNEFMDGSIAIAVGASDNVDNGGIPNIYNADRHVLSDDQIGGSSNISLGTGILRDPFLLGDLFNHFPTLDLHPICLASNPSVSLGTAVDGFRNAGGGVYYAGAILPACSVP